MQYFKRELWLDVNTPSSGAASSDQWMINLRAYQKQLKRLQPRLGPRLYRFFTQISLHDGTLSMMSVGDKVRGRSGNKLRTEPFATLEVLDASKSNRYTLVYEGIRRLVFDYPSEEPLFHYNENGPIGDWGYDEITPVDKTYLRHEVLFSSGTSLLLEFMRFKYRNARVKNKRA